MPMRSSNRLMLLLLLGAALAAAGGAEGKALKKKDERGLPVEDVVVADPPVTPTAPLMEEAPAPAPEPAVAAPAPTPAPQAWSEPIGVPEPPAAAPAPLAAAPERARAPTPAPAQEHGLASAPITAARTYTLSSTLAAPAPAALAATQLAAPDAPAAWTRALWLLPVLGGLGMVLALRKGAVVPTHLEAPEPVADVPTLLRAGHAATEKGDLAGAILWFDRAIALAPDLAVAHFCRGVCLGAMGRTLEAYESFDEAMFRAPDDATYRIHFARAALALGRRANEAMDALVRVTREMPELGAAMLEDPQLAGLRDHPRFLMMCGRL